MRFAKKLLCCLFALGVSGIILYTDLLFSFPSEITMLTNEAHSASLGTGVFISNVPYNVYEKNEQGTITPLKEGEYEATLSLGNRISFKKVKLNVKKSFSLNASGQLIGLRIYNTGLIVTETAPVTSRNKLVTPAQNAGIMPGDIILKINGVEPPSAEGVQALLKTRTSLTLQRNNTIKTITLYPAKDDVDGKLKIGVWVRDSTAGVGTLTFFDSESSVYGALGHSISDYDTGTVFNVKNGSIEKSSVVSVKKGSVGTPGEICGSFSAYNSACGAVLKNCESGVFGKLFPNSNIQGKSYPIGVMCQVKEGDATILSTVDKETKEYKIKILRSMPFGSATKGMMIEITDPLLLEKTGGIIQGMSGSPIIQNGKLVGAVTHVLVNDPTRGYGIFIENMLSEAN